MCVLSVSGTAAVINPKYTPDIASTSGRVLVATSGSAPKDSNQPSLDVDKDYRKFTKDIAQSLPTNDKISSATTTISDMDHETDVVSTKSIKETGCTLCHIPYRKSSTFDMHTKKCSTCK